MKRIGVASSLVIALSLALLPQPADSNYGIDRELTRSEVNQLQKQIRIEERELKRYKSAVRSLEDAAGSSNKSGRRQAIQDLEAGMVAKILHIEERIGTEHTIQRHGQEAREVRPTDSVGNSSTPSRTKRNLIWKSLEQGVNSPGYRLIRMQEIYRICATNRQQSIDRVQSALDKYIRLSQEFARLSEIDLEDIQERIPETTEPEWEPMPWETEPEGDSTEGTEGL